MQARNWRQTAQVGDARDPSDNAPVTYRDSSPGTHQNPDVVDHSYGDVAAHAKSGASELSRRTVSQSRHFKSEDRDLLACAQRPNLPALTSLRFFAALFVVIFHYRHKEAIFPFGISHFGYEAVTFFFILSGFILTYTHARPKGLNVSLRAFLTMRIARIAPAYYLALVVALPSLLKSPWFAAPFVVLMVQAWIPPLALAWNLPAWSLSNEMFFYLCYPAFYWLALRIGAIPFFCVAATVLIATTIYRDTYLVGEEWHHFSAYFPLLNLPQFMWGLALGNLFLRGLFTHWTMLVAGLLSLLGILIGLEAHTWLTNTSLLSVVFSFIVLGAAQEYIPILSSRPLFILGDASYSIYILHFPIGGWWNKITAVLFKLELHPTLDFSLYLVGVLGLSVAALYWVEKPGRRAIQRWMTAQGSRDRPLEPSRSV